MLAVLFHTRNPSLFFLVAICCSSAVFVPFWVSWKRQRRQPEKWGGQGYLMATAFILALNTLMFGFAFLSLLFQ
jgi:hypothetical protein